jgi:hypothetical protein
MADPITPRAIKPTHPVISNYSLPIQGLDLPPATPPAIAPTCDNLCDISSEEEDGDEEEAVDGALVLDTVVGSGSLILAESNMRSVPVLLRTKL